jgi:pSer/pThr/pTyr-binding forkhead associated (FHA) protein
MTPVTLRILDGSDRGRTFDEIKTPLTIGREEGNTIRLNDDRISRFHIKIQQDEDKLVLTDLTSTNGTKVNGSETQVRILRYGDLISIGRSLLLYGSRDQIGERLARLRRAVGTEGSKDVTATVDKPTGNGSKGGIDESSLDFELNWAVDGFLNAKPDQFEMPEVPGNLSPAQAAQLTEMLDYLHARLCDLARSVKTKGQTEQIMLEQRQWQAVMDLQNTVAKFLRTIGHPDEDG